MRGICFYGRKRKSSDGDGLMQKRIVSCHEPGLMVGGSLVFGDVSCFRGCVPLGYSECSSGMDLCFPLSEYRKYC